MFHSRHFVRYLGICKRKCVNLLQLMFGVITHNSVKKRSFHINKWLNYGRIYCFTAAILSIILDFVIGFVSNFYKLMCAVITHNSVKKRSLHINKAELGPNIVFHGRHFVRHLGICNPICLKLLQVMSGDIPSNLKEKRCLYLKPFS